MSVRRLADQAVQPAAFAFNAENAKWADWKIGLYPAGRQQSAVIPLLMRAQDQEGWVSRPAIEKVADMLGMPYIRVLEVATFYTQFQLQPVGTRAHIQVCGTTPCMLRGAEALREVCQNKIHHEPHHLNEDGTMSWEEVECIGACVNAPMVAIFHDTYEDLTVERFEEIVDAFAAGKGDTIKPGPQVKRQFSAAEGGATSLKEKPTAKRVRVEAPPAPAAAAAPATPKVETKAEKPAAKPAVAAAAALFARPEGEPDDLKMISGVGPVLEGKLHAAGVTRWSQIAAFKKADIAKLEDGMGFKGRVERDDWLKQAKALAKGGEAEYIRVFGKKPR